MPDLLSVELEILDDKATVKVDRFTQSLHSLNADINNVGKNSPFAEKLTTDFVALEKKSNDVRKAFQNIQTTRLDSGNIGYLTREIVKTSERARQLQNDITGIRHELANPNRKSSIAFLTEELKAAETEADRLNRKLDTVNIRNGNSQTSRTKDGAGGGSRRGRITNLQATVLELTDDFAPEGFNKPYNAAARGILAVNAVSLTTLATFGAIAAAGYGIVKVTQNIREEAEKRLKVENALTGAINKQIIAQKEGLKDLQKARENATFNRQFSRDLQTDSVDELKARRDTLEKLKNLIPAAIGGKPNDSFEKVSQQLLALDAQIEQIGINKQNGTNNSFNQRFEDFRKSQENAIASERKRNEEIVKAERKRNEDIEKAKTKVKELEAQYISTFDALFQKTGAANPIYSVFSEGDKALKELKKNLAGLPPEVQAVALAMQQKINFRQLLEAQTGNKLSVLDLRQDAANFRNPFDGDKQKKDQEDFVKNFLRRNPNYLFLQNKNSLDDETRSKILKQFAPSFLTETPADRLNKNLNEKFNLLYKPGQTAEQQAASDKSFIGLTAGANPLDLSKDLREKAAIVREREAIRLERYQQDAIALDRQQLAVQQQIADNTKNQNKTAEKGTKALELTIKDERNGGTYELQPAATSAATQNVYQDADSYYAPTSPFGINKNGSNR